MDRFYWMCLLTLRADLAGARGSTPPPPPFDDDS